MNTPNDLDALILASDCWKGHSSDEAAAKALDQLDAILEFLPLVPVYMQPLLTDRGWRLLASVVERTPCPEWRGHAKPDVY